MALIDTLSEAINAATRVEGIEEQERKLGIQDEMTVKQRNIAPTPSNPQPPQVAGSQGNIAMPMPPVQGQQPPDPNRQRGGMAAPPPVRGTPVGAPQSMEAKQLMLQASRPDPRNIGTQGGYVKGRMKKALKVEKEFQLAAQAAAKAQTEVEQQNAWDAARDSIMELTGGDEQISNKVADLTLTNPKMAQAIVTQMAEKKYDTSKAAQTTINLPGDDPLNPYIKKLMERGEKVPEMSRLLDTSLSPEERMYGNDPYDPEELQKAEQRKRSTLQKSAGVIQNLDRAEKLLDESYWAAGTPAAIVRAITRNIPGGGAREGEELGLFERDTDAGELISILDPIKSNIAQEYLNQMRQMSATGGALGNVSNFEVRMLMSSIASLEGARGKEGLKSAIGDIRTAFSRSAFLAANGDDMVQQALKAGVEEDKISEYITKAMQKKFPISKEFEDRIYQTPEWNPETNEFQDDGTPPMTVDPSQPIPIPTGGSDGVMSSADYLKSISGN